ncbi:MAG: hypothetical protein ACR5KV_07230 [Wolbachia sp.]
MFTAVFGLNCKRVESLVEKLKQENDDVEQILSKALEDANQTRVERKNKESRGKIKKLENFLKKSLSRLLLY